MNYKHTTVPDMLRSSVLSCLVSAAMLFLTCCMPNIAGPAENHSAVGAEWYQLGRLGPMKNRGYFLLEVVESTYRAPEDVDNWNKSGTFISGRILEILGGEEFIYSDPFLNGASTVSWSVGAVVSTALDRDFACEEGGRRPGRGDRLIVAPSRDDSAVHIGEDGKSIPLGGVVRKFLCVDANGDVAIDDAGAYGGVDEFGRVTLAQFRDYARQIHSAAGETVRAAVSEECAHEVCSGDQVCFFGSGCAQLTFRAPSDQLIRSDFPPQGVPAGPPDAGHP